MPNTGTHRWDTIGIANMTTTRDIGDPLLREARKIAARERTTLAARSYLPARRVIAIDAAGSMTSGSSGQPIAISLASQT
jgi:hypothetical protein